MIGKLVKLFSDRGYGFIWAGGKEYFMHKREFRGHWSDLVEDYDREEAIYIDFTEDASNPKGLRASAAIRTDYPNQA